jgi:ketosteroid isomerase-like protein
MESHGGGFLLDDRPYDNHYVMALEVREGRVSALREYMDSYYVHELLKRG